jgi:hypothetical protein
VRLQWAGHVGRLGQTRIILILGFLGVSNALPCYLLSKARGFILDCWMKVARIYDNDNI